jgi:hypothetical protein
MTMMNVQCGECGTPLNESPSDADAQPCPACGSITRLIKVSIEDTLTLTSTLGHKAKREGERKPFSEGKQGDDWSRRLGRYVTLSRHIDRDNDRYTETVTDPQTGEIIHQCSEPLNQHLGHGSDTKNRGSRVAPVQKQHDDYVIYNGSNTDTSGTGVVNVWTLSGPDITAVGLMFKTRDEAEAEGRRRAEARSASLWQHPDASADRGELVVSFRK